jgi:hypothetical protein
VENFKPCFFYRNFIGPQGFQGENVATVGTWGTINQGPEPTDMATALGTGGVIESVVHS